MNVIIVEAEPKLRFVLHDAYRPGIVRKLRVLGAYKPNHNDWLRASERLFHKFVKEMASRLQRSENLHKTKPITVLYPGLKHL